eukprot:403375484
MPKEKIPRMHEIQQIDPPKLVQTIIEKNTQKLERREKLNLEKIELQKNMILQKQKLISKMYVKKDKDHGSINLKQNNRGGIEEIGEEELDLIQNEKFQKNRRKKARVESLLREVNRDIDLDQNKFLPDELKFPTTAHEKHVTSQKLKDYDEQLPDFRQKYSYIKKNKKQLSQFMQKSNSQPSLGIQDNHKLDLISQQTINNKYDDNLQSEAMIKQQSFLNNTRFNSITSFYNSQEFHEHQKKLQLQNKQRLKTMNQEIVFIRNNLHQKSTEFGPLLDMVNTLKEFFPLQSLKQRPRNYLSDARKSVQSVEDLKEINKNQVIVIDPRSPQNFDQNFQNFNGTESSFNQHAYSTNNLNINFRDSRVFTRRLEKKHQMEEKNAYLNIQQPDYEDESSSEEETYSPTVQSGRTKTINEISESIVTSTKGFQNQKILEQSNKALIKINMNPKVTYPNIMISQFGLLHRQEQNLQNPQNMQTPTSLNINIMSQLDLDQSSQISRDQVISPLKKTSQFNKQSPKKTIKNSKVLLSSIHDDPVIQSIITNGQVNSFLKVKRDQIKQTKKSQMLSPTKQSEMFIHEEGGSSTVGNLTHKNHQGFMTQRHINFSNGEHTSNTQQNFSGKIQSINHQPMGYSDKRRGSLNFEVYQELHKQKVEKQLLKKIKKNLKRVNADLQPTILRSQLNKHLSSLTKNNSKLNVQNQEVIDPIFSQQHFDRKYQNYDQLHLQKDKELHDIKRNTLDKFREQIKEAKIGLIEQIHQKEREIKEFKMQINEEIIRKMKRGQERVSGQFKSGPGLRKLISLKK